MAYERNCLTKTDADIEVAMVVAAAATTLHCLAVENLCSCCTMFERMEWKGDVVDIVRTKVKIDPIDQASNCDEGNK